VSGVAMCEVKSGEKTAKDKPPPKKIQWSIAKSNGLK